MQSRWFPRCGVAWPCFLVVFLLGPGFAVRGGTLFSIPGDDPSWTCAPCEVEAADLTMGAQMDDENGRTGEAGAYFTSSGRINGTLTREIDDPVPSGYQVEVIANSEPPSAVLTLSSLAGVAALVILRRRTRKLAPAGRMAAKSVAKLRRRVDS